MGRYILFSHSLLCWIIVVFPSSAPVFGSCPLCSLVPPSDPSCSLAITHQYCLHPFLRSPALHLPPISSCFVFVYFALLNASLVERDQTVAICVCGGYWVQPYTYS